MYFSAMYKIIMLIAQGIPPRPLGGVR